MSTKETMNLIDKQAVISLNGLSLMVKIMDVKTTYGKTRYLVTPLSGAGAVWVERICL